MSHFPADPHDISVKLASVLEDIGVNENTIQMKRRLRLLTDNLANITRSINQEKYTYHSFGSQSEGTTTIGLDSDCDALFCDDRYIVLQDIIELKPGVMNLLMFQDESTPPGYCMLQMPDRIHRHHLYVLPDYIDYLEQFTTIYTDKIMVKNRLIRPNEMEDFVEHGPGVTKAKPNIDIVFVIPFRTLPNFVSDWIQKQLQKGRITHDMKTYIECHPCYAVPVGCKGSATEDIEWRISTSHAERCVMFSLNITQIQCYVMLKLMLQTHLKHPSEQGLSSFMCKNILLLCIEDTVSDDWNPPKLLSLFRFCLLQMKYCVSEEYCPHFIMHENNLMAGKFKPEVKLWLLDKIHELYQNSYFHFLFLTTDDVGRRLQTKLDISRHHNFHFMNPEEVSESVFDKEQQKLAVQVNYSHRDLLHALVSGLTSFKIIIKKINHLQKDMLQQTAIPQLAPLIYGSLGCEIAARDIKQSKPLSPDALVWLSLGLDSDVTSGRLKLASVYYCTADYSKTEAILRVTEYNYDSRIVLALGTCTSQRLVRIEGSTRLKNDLNGKNKHSIRHDFAYGIKFLRSEIHCVPKELQYEMFRSTKEDLTIHRNKSLDYWMDWAVVDPLPYLYFLLYKTYGHLQRPADQKQALNKLACSINTPGRTEHAETALNLLGQCIEQEYGPKEAFFCYTLSLKKYPRNNAASIHICRLLNSIISAM